MTAYTDFHYSPTGSGVISGAQVLEQTEQGINGLGQYVQDNVSGAIDTANQALTIAQTANTNATTALNTANSFSDAITTANQTANNALTTAQSAQSTANAASSLATTANNNATSALNAANAATSNVNTLTSTVNGLGNRMTAAENAISANAGNITTLQTNLQTTNNNVTAAANAASAAQATATSAQSTATLARNQAYVLRYTGTTITGGGTIAYADIDNTDNIKAGDKIIDISGAIYDIASVDTANQTVTVGASEIINLAVLPDLFNSANTWTGDNTFSGATNSVFCFKFGTSGSYSDIRWIDNNSSHYATLRGRVNELTLGLQYSSASAWYNGASVNINNNGSVLIKAYDGNEPCTVNFTPVGVYPTSDKALELGTSTNRWKTLNGINPGVLSLPSASYIDISSSITDRNYGANYYTAPSNGYVCIGAMASSLQIANDTLGFGISAGTAQDGYSSVYIPVRTGDTVRILLNQTSTDYQTFRFYPCQGNV